MAMCKQTSGASVRRNHGALGVVRCRVGRLSTFNRAEVDEWGAVPPPLRPRGKDENN